MRWTAHLAATVAADLGGTKLALALFNSRGIVLEKSTVPLGDARGAAVGRLICEQLRAVLALAGRRRLEVTAIGLCVPGIVREGATVWAPNIGGWEDYPLRLEIQAALGPRRLPVRLEDDRACYILGERWHGKARGCRHAIFLAAGTGIGAGILVDGRVLRGADGAAGAAGWMALRRPFLLAYKKRGCLESHAAGPGLAEAAAAPDGAAVFKALETGDPRARRAVRRAVECWGMAAANLVSLFNPEIIIFGGGLFGPAAQWLEQIRREAERWAQPVAMSRVRFEVSALGAEAGLHGAAFIARQGADRT